MTNLKKLIVLTTVVIGIVILYLLVERFNQQEGYPRVFKEYKEKGKSTQFNMEDVQKGFQ